MNKKPKQNKPAGKPGRTRTLADLVPDPTDFTIGGQCSRCGGCCSSVLPVSDEEVKRLRDYARAKNITPKTPEGENVVYMHCPFLSGDPKSGPTSCLVYDIRPAICRCFSCHGSNNDNVQTWVKQHGVTEPPEPDNIWKIFDVTGVRTGGVDILYSKAPTCRIQTSDGGEYQFKIGHVGSFVLNTGYYIPHGIITDINEKGVQMFDGNSRKLVILPFQNIAEVTAKNCIIRQPDNAKHEEEHDKNDG